MAYKFNPFTGKLEEYGPVLTGTGTVSAAADGTAGSPGIAFANDLNTGIYRPGSDQIAVATAGVGRLFVDANGNVGVGTSSPATKLEVAGGTTLAARFTITGNNNPSGDGVVASFGAGGPGDPAFTKGAYVNVGASSVGNVYFGCDSGYPGIIRIKTDFPGTRDLITIDPAGSIAFLPAGNERLRITSAGNVGLGTSSPQQLLHVHNSSAADARIKISNGTTGSGQYDGFELSCGSTGLAGIIQWEQQPIYFYTNNGSAVDPRLAITAAGNVGIGTNAPSTTLDCRGVISTNDALYCYNSARDGLGIWYNPGGAGVNQLTARVNGGDRLTIDGSGRLLVGTSSARSNFFNTSWTPRSQIEGTSDTTSAQALICNSSDIYSSSIQFAKSRGATIGSNTVVQANDYLGSIGFQGSDGTEFVSGASIEAFVDGTPGANDMPTRLVFSTTADGASSPTERMRITSTGNVQCASATGGSPVLSVDNSSNVSGSQVLYLANRANANDTSSYYIIAQEPGVANRFFVYGNGNVANTNNSYGAISDVKLKENIIDASSQWNDLKALRVRNYNFKAETGQQTHTQIGLVAQEVEVVSPGLIYESPDLDAEGNDLGTVTKSVNYSVLYMKAVKALQEAMERIEVLEQRLSDAGIA
jgi:hypothetical protein